MMKKRTKRLKFWYIFFAVMMLQFVSPDILAQDISLKKAQQLVSNEKAAFKRYLSSSTTIDSNLVKRLNRFIEIEVDSIQKVLVTSKKLPDDDKVKGVRSIEYVLKNLKEKLDLNKLDMYDIPGALESYKTLLSALMFKGDYVEVLKPLGEQRTRLLANTFWQCKECNLLDDITTYKRIASAPDFILMNLEKQPGQYFRDSLLFIAAANSPFKMAEYLERNNNELTAIIRNSPNKYVQQVVKVSGTRDATDLLPFVEELANGELTVEDVMKERSDVNKYFGLLVNALQKKTAKKGNTTSGFETSLLNAIKEKSLYFYVRSINDLHDSPDAERFASVKGLRAQDLYYIITSTGEELYTSSYLGLYKRMMDQLKGSGSDSIFTIVNYDQFHKFFRLASNYNVIPDFLSKMEQPVAKKILSRFIGRIENDTRVGLEKAMDVADLFTGITSFPEINRWVYDELENNYKRVKSEEQYFGARLYGILLELYDLVQKNDPNHPLWNVLGNHERLDANTLKNNDGVIVHQVMFFGDKDGIASYRSFMNLFKDNSKWNVKTNDQWTEIKSLSGKPIALYANLPLSNEELKDIEAQRALSSHLNNAGIKPGILIHRGHSYHLSHTFDQLQPSNKLVILGSCGGYNNNLSIANFSPDAQIIVSKKVGSKFVNDPLIDVINKNLLAGNDIIWKDVWSSVSGRLEKDAFAMSMFNEYIPPSKNVNIFVLKLFNNNSTAVKFP